MGYTGGEDARHVANFSSFWRRLKTPGSSWWPRIIGLLALCGIVAGVVGATLPPPSSLERSDQVVLGHLAIWYFLEADAIVKRFSPDDAAVWSQYNRKENSGSGPLIDGYWVAQGFVRKARGDVQPWMLCFKPETKQVLYVQVGPRSDGDFSEASRLISTAHARKAAARDASLGP